MQTSQLLRQRALGYSPRGEQSLPYGQAFTEGCDGSIRTLWRKATSNKTLASRKAPWLGTVPTERKLHSSDRSLRGRTDIYARYWENRRMRTSGYAPARDVRGAPLALTDAVVKAHLLGIELIGVYPLLPDNTTYFLAIDFDGSDWLREAIAVLAEADRTGTPGYLERSKSGNGGHLWFFFATNIPAWKARVLGAWLLHQRSGARVSFDRLFPSQSSHTGKGMGNLIALPLNGKYVRKGNTMFIGADGTPYPDQWRYLQSRGKITEEQVDRILATRPTSATRVSKSGGKEEHSIPTTSTPQSRIALGGQIFIPYERLPANLLTFLRHHLNFANPLYSELQRKGISTWNTPRWISTLERRENGIAIPAGFLPEIQRFAAGEGISLETIDQRIVAKPVLFPMRPSLTPQQQAITRELLKSDRAVLHAEPGFGKTVVALYCVQRRRQPTLVLVHRKALLRQWREQATACLGLGKGDIGVIGDNQWRLGKRLTVASYQTIARRGTADLKEHFGFVIVDECHRVPAKAFTRVLKELPARYVLGLTATPFRRDKLDKLISLYVGPILTARADGGTKGVTVSTCPSAHVQVHIRRTPVPALPRDFTFQQIGTCLIRHNQRNEQVIADILPPLQGGCKCLVLTERVEHCVELLALLRRRLRGTRAAIVTGRMTRSERENALKRLHQPQFQLLIATGATLGEGFDWPELTHLFLAFPISWKGKLIQYLGRVQRDAPGKHEIHVYDYVDEEVPMLRLMYFKRLRAYRQLGLVRSRMKHASRVSAGTQQMRLL